MYLATKPQPDAARAWLEATQQVFAQPQHEAYNVIVDLKEPVICDATSLAIIQRVDGFLRPRSKPLMTVANTIFPNALYKKHGIEGLYETFHDVLLPKIRKDCNWTGYYFERMTKVISAEGRVINPLQDVIRRISDPSITAKNKFEIAIFDPFRDLSDSPYGGQCMSHLSFKLAGKAEKKLMLTVTYRNHYYIEKLLGNLMGLAQLLSFVSKEAGVQPGSLTILSTHATTTQQCKANVGDIKNLIDECAVAVDLAEAA
ncbi:hypothetical protein [uncultured Sulfitobacter sp.]|uniref:hypothetical protein n=1 Tax=uncultured Sulfitobacter sp. TaxID=191468 RepID=UPI00261D6E36|nr:hypothetical protein [uncultured Sulfitobacter sp.]